MTNEEPLSAEALEEIRKSAVDSWLTPRYGIQNSCQVLTLKADVRNLVAEVDRLRAEQARVRDEALEEAANICRVFKERCVKQSFTEDRVLRQADYFEQASVARDIEKAIRSLKSQQSKGEDEP